MHVMISEQGARLTTTQDNGTKDFGHVGLERSAQSDVGSKPPSLLMDEDSGQQLQAPLKSSDLTVTFLRVRAIHVLGDDLSPVRALPVCLHGHPSQCPAVQLHWPSILHPKAHAYYCAEPAL